MRVFYPHKVTHPQYLITFARLLSSVVGLGGFAAGIASMGNAQIVGYVLTVTHNNYVPIFVWASTMYVAAWFFIQLLVPKIEPAAKVVTLFNGKE